MAILLKFIYYIVQFSKRNVKALLYSIIIYGKHYFFRSIDLSEMDISLYIFAVINKSFFRKHV